jgi:tetratricopeptide (TPR) repeat protein
MPRWAILGACTLLLVGACGDEEEYRAPPVGDAQSSLDKAWQFYSEGRFNAALSNFRYAAGLDRQLADTYNGMGWATLNLADVVPKGQPLEDALTAFDRAVAKDPRLADAWVGRGLTLFVRRKEPEDFSEAAEAFAAARAADPSSLYRHDYDSVADILTVEAWSLYYAGDPNAARERLARAQSLDPQAVGATTLGRFAR